MLKKITLFLCLFPVISVFAIPKFDGNLRQTYNFNSAWKLQIGDIPNAQNPDFNDNNWKAITLPHAFNEDEAFRVYISQLTDTVVWYRKHFKLPASDNGKKVFIEFEGVRLAADVYLNGEKVGYHENGVMAFGFDITDKIKYNQDNVIAVRVDNDWNYHEDRKSVV